ncbi:MAG: hydroxyethylthiazole kinase [Gammaproteobacteria bacterium]|nr:hydroxyethylthiazole kinase [Gammaproteobacteria bacterium]
MKQDLSLALKHIRNQAPLVLNITNLVTMDFIANGLLCLGASPIMSNAVEELDALVSLSAAVVINLGTLNPAFLDMADKACKLANLYDKPIVLDPVGAGATAYRTEAAIHLLKTYRINIIRGNASEITALSGASHTTKGVDSAIQTHEAIDSAHSLAHAYQTVLCISGQTDLIVNESRVEPLRHGSPLMPRVTGSGCLLTAVVAAFHAVEADAFQAAKLATLYYTLCGERAAHHTIAPGSFKVSFLDALALYE